MNTIHIDTNDEQVLEKSHYYFLLSGVFTDAFLYLKA